MFTIRDVAKIAGVSRSTVSLVLNNSPLVKENTRQKVLDIIREIDYVPNNSARSLSSKVMYCLAIIAMVEDVPYDTYEFNYETGLFSHDVSSSIFKFFVDSEYSVVTERFCYHAAQGDLPRLIKNRRVDGAFILGGLYKESFIEQMLTKNIPFVVVGGNRETKVDSVTSDPKNGTELAIIHLIETGHRNICLVNAPASYRSSFERQSALEEAKRKNGRSIKWTMVRCPHNTGEGGYIATKSLFESGVKPDSIIAANTTMAMGVLRYLYEKQIRVPGDISVIAYEDSILSGYSYPAITAVNIRKEYMGEEAARLLLERMKNPDKEITAIVMEPYLVFRDSVRDRRKNQKGKIRKLSDGRGGRYK
jgi:LacI family transcriptional regulator/LacI family purine nucleotide synthesis repressor